MAEGKRKVIPKSIRNQVWTTYCGEEFYGNCLCCKSKINVFDWECSHIVADARGGLPVVTNLRPCCRGCNNSMRDMDMKDYCLLYNQPGKFDLISPDDIKKYEKKTADRIAATESIKVARGKSTTTSGRSRRGSDEEIFSVSTSKSVSAPSLKKKCSWELNTGRTCQRFCTKDSVYCSTHQLKHRESKGMCPSEGCKNKVITPYTLCLVHLQEMYTTGCELYEYKGHKLYRKKKGTKLVGIVTDKKYLFWLGSSDEDGDIIPTESKKSGIPNYKVTRWGKRTISFENGSVISRRGTSYVLTDGDDKNFSKLFE